MIARHRAAAGDAERAIPLLIRAAEQAEGLGAAAEAAAWFTAAAELADRAASRGAPGPGERGRGRVARRGRLVDRARGRVDRPLSAALRRSGARSGHPPARQRRPARRSCDPPAAGAVRPAAR